MYAARCIGNHFTSVLLWTRDLVKGEYVSKGEVHGWKIRGRGKQCFKCPTSPLNPLLLLCHSVLLVSSWFCLCMDGAVPLEVMFRCYLLCSFHPFLLFCLTSILSFCRPLVRFPNLLLCCIHLRF